MFCPGCGSQVTPGAAFCPNCGHRFSSGVPPIPATVPPAGYIPQPVVGYATWGDRAVGYIIDQLLVAALAFALFALVGGLFTSAVGGITGSANAAGGACCMSFLVFFLASLGVGFYNRVYLIYTRGYSIGQGVMHLKVIDAQGNLLTQSNAWIRLLAQIGLALVPMGGIVDLLWPLWDERRQTLHDKAVGCYVIKNQ